MQSTASVGFGVASNHGADKQEFLNAGLSTSHAFGGSGKRSIMQTNQVSIMKTIQSSVMKNPNNNNSEVYAIDENF